MSQTGEEFQYDTQLAPPQPEVPVINPEFTGPQAIQRALANLDLGKLEAEQMEVIKRKQASKRPRAVHVLNALEGMKRTGMKPEQFMINSVPVIPAVFRPFSVVGNAFVPGDANELYKDLIEMRDAYDEERKVLGPRGSGTSLLSLYDTTKAVYGYGEPVKAKTKSRGVSGFLKKVTGTGPKFSYVQRRLLSKPQDNVSRGTITVDPDLSLDEIGVPEEMAWKIYAPYIQRNLVMSGRSLRDALIDVRDRTEFARRMLIKEMQARPVIYSRAPSWHKFNVIAGRPKLIPGDAISINPLVTTGLNADFDGDTLHLHVPSQEESVKEAWDKLMPSKMLFSIRNPDNVVPVPKQELVLGLYTANQRPAKKKWSFPDEASALRAIKANSVPLSDEIDFPGMEKLTAPKQATEAVPSDGPDPFEALLKKPGSFFNSASDVRSEKEDGSSDKTASVIGIPDRKDFGDIGLIQPGDLLDYVVQEHNARRAGRHFDVRLGDKERGLYSWATRKGLPEAGKPVALFRQPLHSHEYKDWEGDIEQGYGAGNVRQAEAGRALVTESSPEGFSFATDKGRWRMVPPTKPDEGWLVIRAGDPPPIKHTKEHMQSLSPESLPGFLESQAEVHGSPKIDGALQVLRFRNNKPELFSHRVSRRTGRPIEHTQRVFETARHVQVPKELRDQEFLGELYGERDGKVIPPQELGGILNSGLTKAVQTKRDRGVKLRLALHGIAGSDLPHAQKRQMLAQVASLLPDDTEVVDEVSSKEEILQLLEDVKAGRHPKTQEGIVVVGADGRPRKVKLRDEADVYIAQTFPGEGKYKDSHGGFLYSDRPGGVLQGRVGTGFDDETRARLGEFVGRTARIGHQGRYHGGAYRAPSFLALHEDINEKQASEGTLWNEIATVVETT